MNSVIETGLVLNAFKLAHLSGQKLQSEAASGEPRLRKLLAHVLVFESASDYHKSRRGAVIAASQQSLQRGRNEDATKAGRTASSTRDRNQRRRPKAPAAESNSHLPPATCHVEEVISVGSPETPSPSHIKWTENYVSVSTAEIAEDDDEEHVFESHDEDNDSTTDDASSNSTLGDGEEEDWSEDDESSSEEDGWCDCGCEEGEVQYQNTCTIDECVDCNRPAELEVCLKKLTMWNVKNATADADVDPSHSKTSIGPRFEGEDMYTTTWQ